MKHRSRAETRAKIVGLWNEGYTVLEIRDAMGYKCSDSIETQLRLAGINPKGETGIDVPKVRALMRAKWTINKIVEEFHYDYTAAEILAAVKNDSERRRIDGNKT